MPKESIKVCVLGDEGVGKSSLTLQYTQHYFPIDFDPTIEDIYTKEIYVQNKNYTLHILDTAVQDEYSPLKDLQFEQAEGFVVVYRIDSPESFCSVADSYRHIMRIHGKLPPTVLIGNKVDLETERLVSTQEAQQLVKELGIKHFFEASAKNNHNIKEAFKQLTDEIISFKDESRTSVTPSGANSIRGKASIDITDRSTDIASSSVGKSTTTTTTQTNSSDSVPKLEKASTFTIQSSSHKIPTTEAVEDVENAHAEPEYGDADTDDRSLILSAKESAQQTTVEKRTRQITQPSKSSSNEGGKCCIIM